jgi:hypothetical protein
VGRTGIIIPATFAALLVLSACESGTATMDAAGGWHDFAEWSRCREMERPGYVFEIENAEGHKLWTPCTETVELPHDWVSGPQRFRLSTGVQPQHSTPMPLPENLK